MKDFLEGFLIGFFTVMAVDVVVVVVMLADFK